ncbi:MAG: thiolase family protein [Balneolales bacterium]|nr:thiolase family protein [Balneolales bacterium]
MDSDKSRQPVFVAGVRTPFLRSGTEFKNLMAYDLARSAIAGLISKTGIAAGDPDATILGTVIQEVRTANLAREAALAAGIPNNVPAHTVSMACISSNLAMSQACDAIRLGRASMVVAGGAETMSDVPIRVSRKLRAKLLESRKYKSPLEYTKLLKGFKFSDLAPELPAIAEFSTGETMGESCDKLAAQFGVSRSQQDSFAAASHKRAAAAWKDGFYDDEVIPVAAGSKNNPVGFDNGIREDSEPEKLAKLRPAFVKPFGTVTAANASFLTDGASACLITSASAAEKKGLRARAAIKDYVFVSQDPVHELLLGPAYALPVLLSANNLTHKDIDVFEFHEAFAGQILANLEALASDKFMKAVKGNKLSAFNMPMERFNTKGGSLSIGHPFGATGTRLVSTAVKRLEQENGRFAVVAACAAGGQGHAMLIERLP